MLQVTNQVTRDSSTGPLKPALGRSWSFVPSTRVLLESKEGSWEKGTSQRAASLAKSPRQVRLLLDPACLGNAAVGLALAPVGVGQEPGSGRGARAAWLDVQKRRESVPSSLDWYL